VCVVLVLSTVLAGAYVRSEQSGAAPPTVKANTTINISDHVYVILDDNVSFVPNVGIIVGDRSTLIVDTGMGIENAHTILAEARKLDDDNHLYIVSTHFHPEHALGEPGFPADATIVRSRAQQDDIDEFGPDTAERFKTFSPFNAELLEGLSYREADQVFEGETTLDLGGVEARVFWLGPTHTRGDTMVFIEDDEVLFAGDVVMNKKFVSFNSEYSSMDAWFESLDVLETLDIDQLVPSHGAIGDASLIGTNRTYLEAIRSQVVALKDAGRSMDEAAELAASRVEPEYPDWTGSLAGPARVAYEEAD
jgi:glyoxylase-like metal-dependent hydrolase (beta-lactamase superfamily II)